MGLTNSILRRQLHVVCVEELQEGAVDRVGELIYFDHLLHIFIPVGLEHGSEVFTPTQQFVLEVMQLNNVNHFYFMVS